ncbi:MAG: hypothetical protein HY553_12965 [Elusimicrobia bacterium]|nr:hypothetical protein [Elusimicrobiota bacterium]
MLSLLIWLSTTGFAQERLPKVYGFNFPVWNETAYESKTALKGLKRLRKTGARWVALTPTWYVDDPRASTLSRWNAPEPGESKTPSDDSVRTALMWAKRLGLKTILKPHVDVKTGEFRGSLSPDDEDAWFAGYEAFILHYARIAQQEGCSLFVIGTELSSLSGLGHGKRWDRLIALIREDFSGPLTYAANWDAVHLTPFWERLDYIGVDGYYPVPGADAGQMRAGWALHRTHLGLLAARWGMPVLFTEIGLSSQSGANMRPSEWKPFGDVDTQVQADYLKAFLDVFDSQDWFAGFLYWPWEPDSKKGGSRERDMTVEGKPASAVLKRYFDRFRSSPP